MAEITIRGDHLHVGLTRWERVFGLLHETDVPLENVAGVEALPDPITEVHGLKAGTGLPNLKLGTWRRPGHTTLAAVRRGQPGLKVTVSGGHFTELLVSQPGADAAASTIRARLEGAAATGR
ncbi:MAG: hypothetical protein AAGC46_02150 [Solirubrobacteraceae bacterium]|nr:hypothetical protein [Patulibacter sp.]